MEPSLSFPLGHVLELAGQSNRLFRLAQVLTILCKWLTFSAKFKFQQHHLTCRANRVFCGQGVFYRRCNRWIVLCIDIVRYPIQLIVVRSGEDSLGGKVGLATVLCLQNSGQFYPLLLATAYLIPLTHLFLRSFATAYTFKPKGKRKVCKNT